MTTAERMLHIAKEAKQNGRKGKIKACELNVLETVRLSLENSAYEEHMTGTAEMKRYSVE